jgi:hypothetical protein
MLSPHGGPGSQPPTSRGSHTLPQQPPVMGPPPTSTPNQLATQLSGMNLSGQQLPPIQNSVSMVYFLTELLVCLLCMYPLSVSDFPLFIDCLSV